MSKKDPLKGEVLAFAIRDRLIKSNPQLSKRKSEKPRVTIFDKCHPMYQVGDTSQGYGLGPLKIRELKSVYELFAWVANEQGAAEETVQAMTEVQFSVNDVTKIKQKDYEEVIKFLVDLRIDELRH